MSWNDLLDLFAEEFNGLKAPPGAVCAFGSKPIVRPKDAAASEESSAAGVEAAIREFIRTERWPRLSGAERFFVKQRLRFAYESASLYATTVKAPRALFGRVSSGLERPVVLEWFLITLWKRSGQANWLGPISEVFGSGNGKEGKQGFLTVTE